MEIKKNQKFFLVGDKEGEEMVPDTEKNAKIIGKIRISVKKYKNKNCCRRKTQ